MELALKESNKLKKGRKKKEDRTESKKQNGRSKGFDELQRKNNHVFFSRSKGLRKPKRRRPRANQGSCPPKPPFWKTILLSIPERL